MRPLQWRCLTTLIICAATGGGDVLSLVVVGSLGTAVAADWAALTASDRAFIGGDRDRRPLPIQNFSVSINNFQNTKNDRKYRFKR